MQWTIFWRSDQWLLTEVFTMRARSACFGFTLMEILIAMILLSLVGAVALSALSSSARITQPKNNVAMNIARGYLEELYEYVRADWSGNNNSPLALTGSTLPPGPPVPQVLDGVTYTTAYQVNPPTGAIIDLDGDSQEDYRKVTMTVTW